MHKEFARKALLLLPLLIKNPVNREPNIKPIIDAALMHIIFFSFYVSCQYNWSAIT